MADVTSSVYTIPSGIGFVDALAQGLLRRWGDDPLKLPRVLVLLPTRRACRSLQDAFLRASQGQPLLLPRLVPIGDLDPEELAISAGDSPFRGVAEAEIPPAIPPLDRLLLLAQLIQQWRTTGTGTRREEAIGEDHAVRLAGELGRLLDQIETEEVDPAKLGNLVREDFAEHWQITLDFLRIVTEVWPAVQAEQGCIGPAARRRLLLDRQGALWRQKAPDHPIIAAGSTGSIPATARLLHTIARLPDGMVVLPGLDRSVDDAAWSAIRTSPSHPQHGLAVLLELLEVTRGEVVDWPDIGIARTPPARARLINAALAPAGVDATWRLVADKAERHRFALAVRQQVSRIDCAGPGEEATVVALVLRQALEDGETTAALVTTDRSLARRVAAELKRWDVTIDDSAGIPLAQTPPGTFLRLTAAMVAEDLAPVSLLAALKHPLAAGGVPVGTFRRRVRDLEKAILHGPRPAPGFGGLKGALEAAGKDGELVAWLCDVERLAEPFVKALGRASPSLSDIFVAHVCFAEDFAATTEQGGAERLWQGDAGEAAAELVADLSHAAGYMASVKAARYASLLAALMAGRVVRPRYGTHPRLAVWGPLEARLQHADVVVLAGLNEGTWPAEADPGPWLSRPMREELGLTPPERRIGLAAHDFAQAFCAPTVYLTRSTRVDGTPTVPSRWLLRLEALLDGAELKGALWQEAPQWLDWANEIDRPPFYKPCQPPAPTPPLAARPRSFSVTQVETWMRDPYSLYARKILGLKRLDPIDSDPGAADLGIIVHEALERFVNTYPGALPDDVEAALIEAGRSAFSRLRARPGMYAFWWPRFVRIAHWLAEVERDRRAGGAQVWAERNGAMTIQGPGGPFRLLATADRIERTADGSLVIVDYKTGAPPRKQEIALGFAPQLPLEAALAMAGGFEGIPQADINRLEFWRLTGGDPAGECKPVSGDVAEIAAKAKAGLERLITVFDDENTAYRATPRPRWAPRYNDYQHLARFKEWSAGVGDEDTA